MRKPLADPPMTPRVGVGLLRLHRYPPDSYSTGPTFVKRIHSVCRDVHALRSGGGDSYDSLGGLLRCVVGENGWPCDLSIDTYTFDGLDTVGALF